MSGLKNTVKRIASASMGKGYSTRKERRAGRVARKQDALDKMFSSAEMPDEEQVRRSERRKAAKRRGSRIENVLTDTLG